MAELIPGVPSMAHGGEIGFLGAPLLPDIPEADPFAGLLPEQKAAAQFYMQNFGLSAQDAVAVLDLPSNIRNAVLGLGSGGGAAADPFAEARFELDQLFTQARILDMEKAQAIASGNLQLAQQIEGRIAQNAQQQFQAQQRISDISIRGQDITRQLGAGNIQATLGTNLGNLQARRAETISNFFANPRDAEQLQLFLGGGTSFLDQLQQAQPVPGQSVLRGVNTPTLGSLFAQGAQQILERPELPFFEQAGQTAQRLAQPPSVESFFNPIEQQTFQQFREAAPGVPIDIAADVARRPGDFRTFFDRLQGGSLKHGGRVITDEPIVGIGVRSGMPKFTLGEPTKEHPEGAPELMEVKPLAHGGTVEPPGTQDALRRLNQDVARARVTRGGESIGQVLGSPSSGAWAESRLRQGQPAAPRPTLPTLTTPSGQTQTTQPGVTPEMLFEAEKRFLKGGLPNVLGSQPTTPALTPSQELFNLQRGLNPRSFFNLLPSQVARLGSRVSRLGVPEEDFFASVFRQFPQGMDPSRIFSAGF
jgi:hypothetical protein